MNESFSKKIKGALSVFGYVVVLIALILWVFADKIFDVSGAIYRPAIYIAVIGYIVVFFAVLIGTLISKLGGLSRFAEILDSSTEKMNTAIASSDSVTEKMNTAITSIDTVKEEFSSLMSAFSDNLEKEYRMIAQSEIDKYVLDSEKVIALESSVGNYPETPEKKLCTCKIYIQSSLFVLEKGPLENAILWNLRKGVKYIYIIPSKDVYINEYYDMLRDWYRSFSKFLNSKSDYNDFESLLEREPEFKRYWSREYTDLYKKAGNLWAAKRFDEGMHKSYCKKCEDLFLKLIETHIEDESEFYITVAVYEVKRNQWEAIIKLPTQNINDEYYAFQIPSINQAEKSSFIRSFQSKYKQGLYESGNLSTLGGVLKLDPSRIFE